MTTPTLKVAIQVRDYHGQSHYTADKFDVVETIHRKVWAEAIGNFNPIFCRYNSNNRVLVHADGGDVSDPFRRTEDQLQKMFIVVKPNQPFQQEQGACRV